MILKQDMRNQIERVNDLILNNKEEQHIKNDTMNEKINRIHQEAFDKSEKLFNETDSIYNEITKLKEQMKFLIKER